VKSKVSYMQRNYNVEPLLVLLLSVYSENIARNVLENALDSTRSMCPAPCAMLRKNICALKSGEVASRWNVRESETESYLGTSLPNTKDKSHCCSRMVVAIRNVLSKFPFFNC